MTATAETPPDGSVPSPWLQVWIEAGREGQVFTYANPHGLPVGIGDLVQVPLQGRRHAGLVLATPAEPPHGLEGKTLRAIEAVLQTAAVDGGWQELLREVAEACHTGVFRTLKSALPPGWLGQRPHRTRAGTPTPARCWQIVRAAAEDPDQEAGSRITARQQDLLNHLAAHDNRCLLRDLVAAAGFSRDLIERAERRGTGSPRSGPGAAPDPGSVVWIPGVPWGPGPGRGPLPPAHGSPGRGCGGDRPGTAGAGLSPLGSHRSGQDRGVSAGRCSPAGRREQCADPRPRDRADSPAAGSLPGAFRPRRTGVPQRHGRAGAGRHLAVLPGSR